MAQKKKKPRPLDDRQSELFGVEQMTHVAPSDWVIPSSLPDELHGDVIGVDVETCDIGLQNSQGGGWAWSGGGFPVGYSVTADNFSAYLPVCHANGENMDPSVVRRWLNHVLRREDQTKVFAHAMYDLGWMQNDGISTAGPIIDVQWAEALLDEYRLSYSLNAISKARLNRVKDETLLEEAARAHNLDPKKDLWKLPPKYVGPYATVDSQLPRDIWAVQKPLLEAEDLMGIFDLEHSLLPLYMDMRRRGVRVDVDYANQLKTEWREQFNEILSEIRSRTGILVDVWAAKSVAKALDTENIAYRWTATRQPSITAQLLESTDHWLTKLILSARRLDKLIGTFIDGQILGQIHNGRLHGQIHPLKSDDGGTVTGRLSMSDPNLQFIPARTKEGKEIRRCLVPEEDELFASLDFNQQEPRLLVHFAYLVGARGAREAREMYMSNAAMNYHEFAADLTGLEYKRAKILNLAIIYGRGIATTAEELGLSHEETKKLFNKHEEKMPFAKAMSETCQARVRSRGYLRSLLGRRARFPNWEPADWNSRDGRSFPLEQAQHVWPNQPLVRSRLNKSLNSLIQPSAADQTKAAMRAVLREGYGKHVLVQVHDELGCSVPDRKTAEDIAEIMVSAVPLEIPSKVSVKTGPNWRDAD